MIRMHLKKIKLPHIFTESKDTFVKAGILLFGKSLFSFHVNKSQLFN